MKRERDFWTKHWLEHFILLCLVFLIGLTLLFCRRCQDQDFSGALDRVAVPPEVEVISEPENVVPIEEDVIVDRRRDAGGDCGEFCVTLAWQTVDDLDLRIRQPNGKTISIYRGDVSRDLSTGGVLDVDANRDNRLTTDPAENITWSSPLSGNYTITVQLWKKNSSSASMPFTLLLKGANGNSRRLTGRVSSQSKQQSFNVSYPF